MDQTWPAGGNRRNLLFVSYCRADAEWLPHFEVFCKPLLPGKGLELWADTDLEVGKGWHLGLRDAINRSQAALLLVTARYLASDFIMQDELPTLMGRGVLLAPVLVGDCSWRRVPLLAELQWLHSPPRPLNEIEQSGRLDRETRLICERLADSLPDLARPTDRTATWPAPAPPLVNLGFNAPSGRLIDVPELPPGYVGRKELEPLVVAVLTGTANALGVVDRTPIGLHGQGGIGKSVLVTALAHDERIRRAFPDGLYWISLGRQVDILKTQLSLLDRIDPSRLGQRPTTIEQATKHLVATLQDRRALLLVDDIWSEEAALAFCATGSRGRVLFTTRDSSLLAASQAQAHEIGVLTLQVARMLAAAVLDCPHETLPTAADDALNDVGRVALAVALLAAAVRGGRTWQQVKGQLDQTKEIYGTHPYANSFKGMDLAVGTLPFDLRQALFGLAVFPPDAIIPLQAISRYWTHTRHRTPTQIQHDLTALASANVLALDHSGVTFHDLQHDYLLLHARPPASLHTDLLNSYRMLLPADAENDWAQLPTSESYLWQNLIIHLHGAEHKQDLARTITSPGYLGHRIALHGTHATETDLTRAVHALPHNTDIAWLRAWLARNAHLLVPSELDHSEQAIAPSLLAWLSVETTRPATIKLQHITRLLPKPYLRLRWTLSPPNNALVRTLTGHTRGVWSVAWSPGGALLASGSSDGTVRIWGAATGYRQRTLNVNERGVRAVAWSPDGTSLATADYYGTIWVWDPVTGHLTRKLAGHKGGVQSVAWAPDNIRLAAAGYDKIVRIWDTAKGLLARTLTGHTDGVQSVAWSSDGARMATGSFDGEIRIWDPDSGQHQVTFRGHKGGVQSVAWSLDNTRLATAGYDRTVQVWDMVNNKHYATLNGHAGRVQAVAWSTDGTHLATGSTDREVWIWDPTTGRNQSKLGGHTGGVQSVAWSPNGDRLLSGGSDGTIRIWDPLLDRGTSSLLGYTSGAQSVAWSPDCTHLASGSTDGKVRSWDPVTGQLQRTLVGHLGGVQAVAWSPDGTRLATGSTDGEVWIWDAITGNRRRTLTGHFGPTQSVAWSPDSTQLATGSTDGEVWIWNSATGGRQHLLSGHLGGIRSISWSPDGTRLAVASDDSPIRLWSSTTGNLERVLTGHLNRVRSLAWSPNGTLLASASDDRSVRIWCPDSGTLERVFDDHDSGVQALAWSPDGRSIASGSRDGVLLVNEINSRRRTRLHIQPILSLSWSAAGIAVAAPGTILVLDLVDI